MLDTIPNIPVEEFPLNTPAAQSPLCYQDVKEGQWVLTEYEEEKFIGKVEEKKI